MIKVKKGNVVYRLYDESKVASYQIDGFKVVKEKKQFDTLKTEAPKVEEAPKEEDVSDEQPKGKRR